MKTEKQGRIINEKKGRRGRKGQVAKEYIVERREKYKGKIYRK